MLHTLILVVFARKILTQTKKLLNVHHVNNGYIINEKSEASKFNSLKQSDIAENLVNNLRYYSAH